MMQLRAMKNSGVKDRLVGQALHFLY